MERAIKTSFFLLLRVFRSSVAISSGFTPRDFGLKSAVSKQKFQGNIEDNTNKLTWCYELQTVIFVLWTNNAAYSRVHMDFAVASSFEFVLGVFMKVWLTVLTVIPYSWTSARRHSKKAWTACLEAASEQCRTSYIDKYIFNIFIVLLMLLINCINIKGIVHTKIKLMSFQTHMRKTVDFIDL